MEEDTSALLVHDDAEPLGALQEALEGLSVRTYRARSCREVMRLLEQPTSPHLVFTVGRFPMALGRTCSDWRQRHLYRST